MASRTPRWNVSLIAAGMAMLHATAGLGATWCVAPPPAGSDSNTGADWGSPFATIAKGIASATNGEDLVLVSNGLYSITAQMSVSNRMTVRSLNGPGVTTVKGNGSVRLFYVTLATNVVIDGFTLTGGRTTTYGGAVFVDGKSGVLGSTEAQILNCIATNNSANDSGGAFATGYGAVTLIRNCLIFGNSTGYGGSGIMGRSGSGRTTVESCTVTRNYSSNGGNGIGSEHGANTSGTNCISYGNSHGGMNAGTWVYSCSSPVQTGAGNTGADPRFFATGTGYGVSHAGGDFRLRSGSSALNTGTNCGWMGSAQDIAGNARIQETTVNMGAYETLVGLFDARFSGTPLTGLEPLTTVFTAQAAGTNTSGVGYRWDFNADGSWDTPWSSGNQATNTYAAGLYSVVLWVTNAAGETWAETNASYVLAAPAMLYVSPSGGHVAPYASWTDAATNIQTAVNQAADGSEIIVTNGEYALTSSIVINRSVNLHSVNGPTSTVIRRASGNIRLMEVTTGASAWLIDGFTFRQGYLSSMTYGAGLYVHNVITGTIQNCIFIGNTNVSEMGGAMASGYGAVTTVRNCLFAKSRGTYSTGAYTGRGNTGRHTIENCTFVDNIDQAGLYRGVNGEMGAGPNVVRNCLFVQDNCTMSGSATFQHCLWSDAADKIAGAGNTSGDPLLVTYRGRAYVPGPGSPCINAGTNQAWMVAATDLAGSPRLDKNVDMGAYEALLGSGTIIVLK